MIRKLGKYLLVSGMVMLLAGCATNTATTETTEATVEVTDKTVETEIPESQAIDPSEVDITIYLVRHGKTWFNTIDLVQGFADSPLTEVGIKQAQIVGRNMKDIKFTTAYSSSLGRQKDTLNYILAENNNPITPTGEIEGLKEWNYGGYEGRTNAEMWTPIFEENGFAFDEEWTYYGELAELLGDKGMADAIAANDPEQMAETYDEIVARAQTGMDQIVKETIEVGGGNVLLVSSGGQIPTILEMLVPGDYQGEYIGNCTVTILHYKNGAYTVEVIGDDSYLAE